MMCVSLMQEGTPLYFASQNGFVQVVEVLLDGGANVNKPCEVRVNQASSS